MRQILPPDRDLNTSRALPEYIKQIAGRQSLHQSHIAE
jgi:hypothetical protein